MSRDVGEEAFVIDEADDPVEIDQIALRQSPGEVAAVLRSIVTEGLEARGDRLRVRFEIPMDLLAAIVSTRAVNEIVERFERCDGWIAAGLFQDQHLRILAQLAQPRVQAIRRSRRAAARVGRAEMNDPHSLVTS